MKNVLYKQNVRNLPRAERSERAIELAEAKRRFINDLGHLYARYGLSVTFGRVFGLLLLSDEPLSLDDIAGQLQISKSAISVVTRDLLQAGIVRRLSAPRSRRVLYEASEDMVPIFQATFQRVRQSLPILQSAEQLAHPGRARQRMRDMIALHEFWLVEGEGIIERWRRLARRTYR
jgi:predicted transcriptional regulator